MAVGAATTEVTIRLFGGVSASAHGRVAHLGGPRPRSILGRLAWDSGQLVTVDQLVDDVWGEHPPPEVRSAVQVHVSRLRGALAAIDVPPTIFTRANGYVLEVPNAAVDGLAFTELASSLAGTARWTSKDVDEVRRVLLMWAGRPFAGLESVPFVAPLITWLEGRRTDLVAIAAQGIRTSDDARRLLPITERIASERPLDEAVWSALARLLATAGQGREALNRLATLRASLREQAGLDVGPDVDALEQWILSERTANEVETLGHLPSTGRPRPREADRLLAEHLVRTCQTVTVCGPIGVDVAAIVREMGPGVGVTRFVAASDPDQRIDPSSTIAAPGSGPASSATDLLAVLAEDVPLAEARTLARELRSIWPGRLVVAATGPMGLPGERVVRVGLLTTGAVVALLHDHVQDGRGHPAPEAEHLLIERIAEATGGVDTAVELAGAHLARRRADRVLQEVVGSAVHLERTVALALAGLTGIERLMIETLSRLEGWFDEVDVHRVVPRPRPPAAHLDEAIEHLVDAGLVAFEPARPEPYVVPRPVAVAVRATGELQDVPAIRDLARLLAARSVRAAARIATEHEADAVAWFERRHVALERLAAHPGARLVHRRAIARSLIHTSLAAGRAGVARDLLLATGTNLGRRDLLAVATVAYGTDEYALIDECAELAAPLFAGDDVGIELALRHVRALRHRCQFSDAHRRLDAVQVLVATDSLTTASVRMERGMTLAMEARTGEARLALAAARESFARLRIERAIGACWVYEAWCDLAEGRTHRATHAVARSRAIAAALGHRADTVFTDLLLARCSLLEGDTATAYTLASAALDELRAANDRLGIARALEVLADAAACDVDRRGFGGEAEWVRSQIGAPQSPLERVIAAAT